MPLIWPPFADVPTSKTLEDLRVLNDEILPAVEAGIAAVDAALPVRPYHALPRAPDWVLFELTPEPAADYAGLDDLVTGGQPPLHELGVVG
jgi:hypothetical protein